MEHLNTTEKKTHLTNQALKSVHIFYGTKFDKE